MTTEQMQIIRRALVAMETIYQGYPRAREKLVTSHHELERCYELAKQAVTINLTEPEPGKVVASLSAGSRIDPDNSLAYRIGRALYDETAAVADFFGGEKVER